MQTISWWIIKATSILAVTFILIGELPSLHAQQKTEGIVVWRIEAKSGVSQEDVESLSGYLDAEVQRLSGMRVLSQADIETVLRVEETRQKCDTTNAACMAEIGAALGVPEAVSGDLGRVGDVWILNLRRVNLREVGVLKRASRQAKGSTITAMVDALPGAVAELFDKKPEKKSPYEIAAYSTFFPGLALVALGGVGTWQMKDAWDEYKAAPIGSQKEKDAKDRHATWKGVSTAAYVVGGAAMTTGITLWIIDAVKKNPPTKKKNDEVTEVGWIVGPSENGMTLGVWGRW